MFAAGFFDPNNNGWDITDLAAIGGIILTAAAVWLVAGKVIARVGRWMKHAVREIVREEIMEHTALIQPTSNGGKSLPDIAKRTDRIERVVLQLAEANGITPNQ